RKVERNRHAGAQQRLVSLSLSLRLVQSQLRSPDAAEEILEASREELAQALEELRELARGIHPAVLTDRGLEAALEALAARSPLPVMIEGPDEDLSPSVEAAAYYVVSEALANVTKYAHASSVKVTVGRANGYAVLLDDHRRLLRAAVEAAGGHIVDHRGDEFFLVFEEAAEAAQAAAAAQRAFAGHEWPEGLELRVRMGMHTGEPNFRDGAYL